MKFKFLNTALAGLILSISCFANIANAGFISTGTRLQLNNYDDPGIYLDSTSENVTQYSSGDVNYSRYEYFQQVENDNSDHDWAINNNKISKSFNHCIEINFFGCSSLVFAESAEVKASANLNTGEIHLFSEVNRGNSDTLWSTGSIGTYAQAHLNETLYFSEALTNDLLLSIDINIHGRLEGDSYFEFALFAAGQTVRERFDRGYLDCPAYVSSCLQAEEQGNIYPIIGDQGFMFEGVEISQTKTFVFDIAAGSTEVNLGLLNEIRVNSGTGLADFWNTSWLNISFSEKVDYTTQSSSFLSAPRTNLNKVVDVPEPSTLAIFTLGMIGLASRRFKKQS